MTPQEARKIANRESELYNRFVAADAAWTDRYNDEQERARTRAYKLWQDANDKWFEAVRNYPHLFAPFSATW